MQHAYLDRAYAPPRARRVSILESLYRISPRRWLMLDRKGRICPGGPPIWEIKSTVWLGLCGSNPEPQPDRQTDSQTDSQSQQQPTTLYSPDQTWLVSPCPPARTHARTHTQPTQGLGRTTSWAAGQAGHARTTTHHLAGTLELSPNHHLAKPKPNPQGFVRDSGNVVHQSLLLLSRPSPPHPPHSTCPSQVRMMLGT